ncbi:VPLPA-CTERM sorting domain-containing protein [uncultured Ruegeria sp.]|uniref:VPLPA-CTERM sorting domain-containing protein n=1 Tax=uncultured Ruegeria sp. TaxID=259304 RepID=UPI00262FD8BC|nr:VPLPA-CTERM sorting domain-containing protein [uncultured Ruegeria sp.]
MSMGMFVRRRLKSILALSFIGLLFATPISAVTISTSAKSVDITCSGSCDFWDLALDPDGFNASSGSWLSSADYGIHHSNSNSNRLSLVNAILGTVFSSQSASSDAIGGVDAVSGYTGGETANWTGSGQYYLAWSASDPRYILIRNNTENNVFSWIGKGLSGVDAFGAVAPIPLPAAIWFLIAGIGGLVVLCKRKSHPA